MAMLSIIVRTLGRNLNFLERAIQSVANNSYKNREIIIVLQSMDDDVIGLIQNKLRIYNNKVTIHYLQNKTMLDERSKNLNLGLQKAKGNYIAFLDDDDFVAPKHYENLIKALERHDVAMAYNLAKVISENNVETLKPFKDVYIDKLSMLKDNFITINSFVLDKTKIEPQYLKFNEDLKLAEDYLFLLPIYLYHDSTFVKEKTSFYYIEGEVSKSFLEYEKNNQRRIQYRKLKKLKSNYSISLSEKINLYIPRLLGNVYRD